MPKLAPDDVLDTCWCRTPLDENGECPYHGDPYESASEALADWKLQERLDEE